jgi:hypothetical protein
MKTTIDIADHLFAAAKAEAGRRGVTLRTLIEAGLEHELSNTKRAKPFRLRDASVTGTGPDAWHQMSEAERLAVLYGDDR